MNDVETLCRDNMGLVYDMIRRIAPWINRESAEYDDFVSAGMNALVRAAQRFDASRGFQFSTFACTCIYNQVRRDCGLDSRRRPKLKVVELDKARERGKRDDDPHSETVEVVDMLLSQLPERMRDVVVLRVFERMTLEQIGRMYGLTRSRIEQIEKQAMALLLTLAKISGLDGGGEVR